MNNENNFKGKALNFVIIVKEVPINNITSGGFNINSDVDANEKNKCGIVMSVGNLCPKERLTIFGISISFLKKSTVKINSKVLYDKYKASNLTLDGITYQCVYYSDLIMVF